MSVPTHKEVLFDRVELIEKAEQQAAIADAWRDIAERSTPDQLLSLPVVATAMAFTAQGEAEACERWAAEATQQGDTLLARALRNLAESLRAVATQADVVSSEARGYADSSDD